MAKQFEQGYSALTFEPLLCAASCSQLGNLLHCFRDVVFSGFSGKCGI